MAKNVIINGSSYNGVPAVELPLQGGGNAEFYDTDISGGAGAAASDIRNGKKALSTVRK